MTVTPLSSKHAEGSLKIETGPIVVALGGGDVTGVLRTAQFFQSSAVGGMLAVSVLQSTVPYFMGDNPLLVAPEFDHERAASRLAELKREISDTPASANWETTVEFGDPSYELAALARVRHSPLIVMGLGRQSPIDRWLGVETAARTMRRAPCPVLAVSATASLPFREAVVAMDFSSASISAAMAVVPLMATTAVLNLVHVWEPSMVDDERAQALNAAYTASLPAKFEHLRELLAVPSGITVKHEVREGKVAEHILTFGEAHHADVIVAGRHGLNAIERLFVGSVTTTLLHGTTCSILIAPEPAIAQRDSIIRRMTGTAESRAPLEWAALIDNFSRRNAGRRTIVEVDNIALGAQVVESGYALQGAAYDHHDGRVELMLGDGTTRHMTRTITDVDSIAVYIDHGGSDAALRVAHGSGQTLLTFIGN
jgi:nucleotide-binding universal stress UspA family protein